MAFNLDRLEAGYTAGDIRQNNQANFVMELLEVSAVKKFDEVDPEQAKGAAIIAGAPVEPQPRSTTQT